MIRTGIILLTVCVCDIVTETKTFCFGWALIGKDNPNVAKAGELQSQGVKDEVLRRIAYRPPWAEQRSI